MRKQKANRELVDISIQLAPRHPSGLLLANPVMTAAGTFGYGIEYSQLIDIQKLGAIICKGTTLNPRGGNPQPRLVETTAGLLNSVGLQNIGLEALIRDKAPVWASWRVPVIVNIAGETIGEYVQVAAGLEGVAGISGIEINVSCPNLAAGGIEFGISPQLAAEVTSAVKAASSLPIIVKLSPNVTDIVEIASAVAEAGADALSVINSVKAMAIDVAKGKPALGNVSGGLSGPAIKPIALYTVYEVAGAVDLPIIGCGGIACANDALEFIMAGASAIQVGTANLANPGAALDILKGIERFMQNSGAHKLTELIGIARR